MDLIFYQVIAEAMNREKVVKSKTSSDDVVTETDKKVEELLINGLKAEFPDHRFIAEESCVTTYYEDPGDYEANTELPTWIIDPLDGTINFVHGYPQVCVSVALWAEGRPQLGFVYNPVLDQLFSARTGHGAFLNGRRINVSDKTALVDSLVGGDIMAYLSQPKKLENTIANARAVKSRCHAFRVPGTVAVTLAYVAMGALDAYYETGPRSWDFAAGVALVLEAGGVITATDGSPFDLFERNIVAGATPQLAKELSSVLTPYALPREGREKT
ncbi:hypothetical protein B566_EDAN013788 [Ephemera danica]|nr:hypothetical protein B566_EDAN013788 [Ephemera danica]